MGIYTKTPIIHEIKRIYSVFIDMIITESQIKEIVRESLGRIVRGSLPRRLYHVSNPQYREDIMRQGLKPMVGASYRAHYEGQEDLKPVIFLKGTNDYDSTYDDDRWMVDVEALDVSCLHPDFDEYMAKNGCYVYTKPIAPKSIRLIHKGSGESLNESQSHGLSYEVDGHRIIFKYESDVIGELCYSVSDIDGIASEYGDSVEDFDDGIMRVFDYNASVVNIEDVWVYREYQGRGLFREIFGMGMNVLNQYRQFILRACSDNGFPEDKLVEVYQSFGFIPCQETAGDGTIMILKK